jgi:hypothetical protein
LPVSRGRFFTRGVTSRSPRQLRLHPNLRERGTVLAAVKERPYGTNKGTALIRREQMT